MIADELNINRETIGQILTEDFAMRKLCEKMLPKNLSEEQKQHRMSITEDCLEQAESDPTLLDRIITGDESWFFQYDRETKRQSQQWLSPNYPRPKKLAWTSWSENDAHLLLWQPRGGVHKQFVPPGQWPWIKYSITKYLIDFEKGSTECAQPSRTIGRCITTMHPATER